MKNKFLLFWMYGVIICIWIMDQASASYEDVKCDLLEISSFIEARFATTTVRNVITNVKNDSNEVSFRFQLPQTAFISTFVMETGGRRYYGVAKEKAQAREEYETRAKEGENVGLVESRGTELFQVLLNVGAGQQATFVLQYQQLLTRYQHKYATTVNLNPGCIVDHINVTITAYEEQGIDQESIGKSDFASILEQSETSVSVEYTPTIEDQKSFGDTGLASDLFFEYDVVHKELDPGLILFKDGYFVHFFSPTGLPVLLVSIVFVVDVSGSMGGEKIMQARESLKAIIPQLNNEDYIGIVKFDGTVSAWQNDVVSVEEFHAEAINYVTQLEAGGSTNLNDAVITGVNILKRSSSSTHSRILVLLTDGQPTAGEVNTDRIIQNSISVVGDSGVSINCLGFGFDLDYNLLERLAINNNGIVHRIYTGQDATEQLQGFYQEVTAPLLAQISFDYPLEIIEFVTAINFPYLFSGGEIVIAGKFEEGQTGLIPINVTAYGIIDSVVFRGTINTDITSDYPLEQLVAYYRIQQLLESRNKEGVNDTIVEQEALEIALKYNFVTELTSLIVVQDQGNSTSNDTAFPDYGDGSDYEDEEDRTFFNHPPAGLPPATTTSTNPSAASGEASPMLPRYLISFLLIILLVLNL